MDNLDGLVVLIDELTGSPGQIAAEAGQWAAVSADLEQISHFLRKCLDKDIPA